MSAAVFFYGTLMSPEVRNRVIYGTSTTTNRESTVQVRPAILKGYKRFSLDHRDYPAVIFTGQSEDKVLGILCENLYPKDLARLDKFEGWEYMRQDVHVAPVTSSPEQQSVACGVYIWIDSHDHLLEQEWSFDGFVNGGKQTEWLQDRCESYKVDVFEVHQR